MLLLLAGGSPAWSAITFVAANSASPGQTGSLAIGIPATLPNDVMLAQIAVRGGSAITITAPAGWTLVNRSNNSTTLAQAVYYRVAGAAEPASYTWTFNSVEYAAGGTLVFRGVDTASPVDAWSARSNGSSKDVTANGVVTTAADAMLVGLFANADGRSNFTPPVGMTERYDTQFGSGKDNATAISAAQAVQAIVGASGNKVATATRSVVSVAHLVALRPLSSAAAPGGFNAFESGTAAGSTNGVIHTKVAAAGFGLDVVALKSGGTAVETAFAGDVKLELVDASAGGSCGAYALIRSLGTLSFAAADQGRKTYSGISEADAWPNARIRMTYPATGTPTIVACSIDNFALRPASFGSVAVSDADSATAGTARSLYNTAASGGTVHKAGRPFRIAATALNAAGAVTANYSGNPMASLTACVLPASGCTLGTLATGAWSAVAGTVTTANASYSEAGAFAMKLADAGFAAADAADGSSAAEMTVESAVFNVGRFVPDHFDLATASVPQFKTFNDTTCATRSFTYVGQPFGYLTLPQATITAKNAAGDTTRNYAGVLWKLGPAGATQTYSAATGTLDTGLVGTTAVAETGGGTGTLTADAADVVAFVRTTPVVPFAADISLSMRIQDTAENGVPSNGIVDTATPALFSSMAFDAGNAIRFGRLVLSNAHGSELLALPVPIETQYWTAGGVFTRNADDHCTQLAAAQVSLSNWQRDLNACETSVSLAGRFNAGRGNLRFSAPGTPGTGNTGSVDLTLQLGATAAGSACVGGAAAAAAAASQSWLQGAWSGGGYTQNPAARASFGLYRGSKPLIYLREIH